MKGACSDWGIFGGAKGRTDNQMYIMRSWYKWCSLRTCITVVTQVLNDIICTNIQVFILRWLACYGGCWMGQRILAKEAQLQTIVTCEAGTFLLTLFIHHKLGLDVALNSGQLKINNANKQAILLLSTLCQGPYIILRFFFMAWLQHNKPWLIILSKCSQWQCNPRKYKLSKTCHWILHLLESEIIVKLWKVGYRCDQYVLVCFQISYIMPNLDISLMLDF